MADTFPRQQARTQRFTLGEPRTFTVSPDGRRVVFLRSAGGSDPVTCLWVLDVATGTERLIADPRELLGGSVTEDLTPEERSRRERLRDSAQGITAYAADTDVRVCAFTLAGRLYTAGLLTGGVRALDVPGPVFDPRPDPSATRLAYLKGRALMIAALDGSTTEWAGEEDPNISWGAAEFVAAEEMERLRGYWWAPDGEELVAARVDVSPVNRWYISDPAQPWLEPTVARYPAAGTPNADVTLHILRLDGSGLEVTWDRAEYPYLIDVSWDTHGLFVTVESRDQRRLRVLAADTATGTTTTVAEDNDETWVDLVAGAPRRLADGRLVMVADRDGARRLIVDGETVTPAVLQVRSLAHVGDDHVLVAANDVDEPAQQHVWRWDSEGLTALTTMPGVHSAVAGGATVVMSSRSLDWDGTRVSVLDGPPIASHAETPLVVPNLTILRVGEERLATALLIPSGGVGDGVRLPVLLDPYGGPHASRVLAARNAHLTSQWFADQGFAVVVIDGRGTPGRGSAWERAVHRDLAGPVLDDQIDGLHALASRDDRLDLTKVAIRGWSFGGYLAALAVLRRPDVFHAAVAGAPPTDWRWYDTHYTERYLGDPNTDPGPYERCSLIADAAKLQRPLLLIHGLADDNVVAAHTLQFSSALLAAGRAHRVLPLSGVTHMASQEEVAENLLLLQLEFLREALGITSPEEPRAVGPAG
jgi:dipeptidyl-peptidase-4